VRDVWPRHEPLRMLPDNIRAAVERHAKTVAL
jgi:hypothetical protein